MNPPAGIEHLIHEALVQLGWKTDAARLADRVARLHIGLPREDEFSVVCAWLGKCLLVHKLDQRQAPAGSVGRYQVPDLLVAFNVGGVEVSALVEVKSKNSRKLSFKPDYLERLLNYARLVRLPLLIAWKHYGLWALFDSVHLKKARTNFNVTFEQAVCESLLGVLAGDFAYTLAPRSGLHLRMRKEELIDTERLDSTTTEAWKTVIDDVFYTDGQGQERRDLSRRVQSLFMAHNLEETCTQTDSHIKVAFTVGEDANKFAHMSLVGLLNWQALSGAGIDWRAVLGSAQPLAAVDDFAAVVNEAMHQGIVTHIFHARPQTMPAFIPT